MKVLITGAGRMGQRHAQGLAQVKEIEKVVITDISQAALNNAAKALEQFNKDGRFVFSLTDALAATERFDTGIMASTANDRGAVLKAMADRGCKHVLVEKPLGQSFDEVSDFARLVNNTGINAYVNLNMRNYDGFIQLKKDIEEAPQLQGFKTITVNTGTIGIGANGIHYLDLLYFLLNADRAEIACAHIDDAVIPSGRGPQFGDFGGWSVINLYKGNEQAGVAMFSLSSASTVFGSWEIVASHGRIYFNEVEQKRIDTFRKADSQMPVNRYFADYLPAEEKPFPAVFLGDLTAKWIRALMAGQYILPTVQESLPVHKLMFDWLAYSKTHSKQFPIT